MKDFFSFILFAISAVFLVKAGEMATDSRDVQAFAEALALCVCGAILLFISQRMKSKTSGSHSN